MVETLIPSVPPKPSKSLEQLSCEAKGGRWEAATNSCIMPQPKAEAPKEAPKSAGASIKPEGKLDPQKFYIGDKEVSRDQYTRVKSLLPGTQGGSGGQIITEEDRALAAAQTSTPEERAIREERQRLSEEEVPERRELSPELSIPEKIPVLGGVIGAGSDVIISGLGKLGVPVTELQPEEMRTVALSEIERQEIERGLTLSETFGKFVESVGLSKLDLFGLSAKDLIETPSENAKEAKTNILKEKRRIANIETNVKLGYLPVSVAQEQIVDIENNVQRLESRIKMLISNSPELKYNSDGVNTIETDILLTKEKIFQAKQNILTGAISDPTEVAILQKLKELGGGEETE